MKLNVILLTVVVVACSPQDDQKSIPAESMEKVTPEEEWHYGFGTDRGEHIHEIMQTSDGGYLGIGQTEESNGDATDILVVKITGAGEFLWQRVIGSGGEFDVGIAINESSNGYFIGGALHQDGNQQRYIGHLDFNGSTIWEQTIKNKRAGMVRGIEVIEDDIVITGYKDLEEEGFVFIADESEGFVMKLDSQGAVIWEKTLSSAQGAKIRKTDNGFFVCTTHWMNDEDTPQDFYLMRLDGQGNEIWAKNYGAESDEHCYDCDVATDGGVILGGHTRSPSYGVVNWDFLMIKVDADGNEEWARTFGQPRGYDPKWIHDEAYAVRQTPDGGFVLVGGTGDEYSYSESGHNKGRSDIWQVFLVKVDGNGTTVWEEVYGSSRSNDAGEYLGLTSDGGFIIGTDSDEAGADQYEPNNFGFLKLGPDPGLGN